MKILFYSAKCDKLDKKSRLAAGFMGQKGSGIGRMGLMEKKKQRGSAQRRVKMTAKICFVLAFLCLIYCIGIVLTKAAGTKFFLVWIALTVFFVALGYGIQKDFFLRIPGAVRLVCGALICLGLAFFCLVEGLVISGFFAKGEPGLAYIVVLGAQMKENGPSVALARRLDCAYQYLTENPETLCVVSGGQGSNEPVSEAEGMYEYLVDKGIDSSRIIREDASTDTYENLVFSRELIPKEVQKIGVVTSNFHVYRGRQLARHQGFDDAVGLGATSGIYFLPNNMLREFFGMMKDWLFGNMRLIG